jgi:hypothetical protein
MSQDFTANLPASGETNFYPVGNDGGLYEVIRDHNAALRSTFEGTAFPSNPVNGQQCTRSDLTTEEGYQRTFFYTGNAAFGDAGWVDLANSSLVYDEVRLARGTKSTLDQRFDVAHNEDGSLKAGTSLNPSEWYDATALNPSYLSSNQFIVDGNQTDIFSQYRRVKADMTTSMLYAAVASSAYDTTDNDTTVTLDNTGLDSGLYNVNYALLQSDETTFSYPSNLVSEDLLPLDNTFTGDNVFDGTTLLINSDTTIAGKMPTWSSFRAHFDGTAQVVGGTSTPMNTIAETFDKNDEFDTTSLQWTPEITGTYGMGCRFRITLGDTTGTTEIKIIKNGSTVIGGKLINIANKLTNGETMYAFCTDEAQDGTDYYEFEIRTTPGDMTVEGLENSSWCFGFRIS